METVLFVGPHCKSNTKQKGWVWSAASKHNRAHWSPSCCGCVNPPTAVLKGRTTARAGVGYYFIKPSNKENTCWDLLLFSPWFPMLFSFKDKYISRKRKTQQIYIYFYLHCCLIWSLPDPSCLMSDMTQTSGMECSASGPDGWRKSNAESKFLK